MTEATEPTGAGEVPWLPKQIRATRGHCVPDAQIVQVKDKILHTIIKYGWKAPGLSSQMSDDRPEDISHIFVLKDKFHTVWQGCISVVWSLSWSHKELALGSFSVYDWMVKMKMMEVFPFITTRLAALCSPFVHFLGILPQPLSHCLPHFPLRQHVLSS